jgi:hypothetical protein
MKTLQNQEKGLDLLYNKAKKRVGFKVHFVVYILILAFLWVVWFFIFKKSEGTLFMESILFLSISWTIVLVGHYFYAYKWNSSLVEKEIRILVKQWELKQNTNDPISQIVEEKEEKNY